MNRSAHTVVGAVVAGGVYVGACRLKGRPPEFGGLLLAAGLGAAVAGLHDVLEPPVNPNHRGFAHSVALTAVALAGVRHYWLHAEAEPEQRAVWTAVALACLSHPMLDATTPRALPLH